MATEMKKSTEKKISIEKNKFEEKNSQLKDLIAKIRQTKGFRNFYWSCLCNIISLLILGGVVYGFLEYRYKNDFQGPKIGKIVIDSIKIQTDLCYDSSLCYKLKFDVEYSVNEKQYICHQKTRSYDDKLEIEELVSLLNTTHQQTNIYYGYDDHNRCYNIFNDDNYHSDGYLVFSTIIIMLSILTLALILLCITTSFELYDRFQQEFVV